jgi:aminopeptidase YwaD
VSVENKSILPLEDPWRGAPRRIDHLRPKAHYSVKPAFMMLRIKIFAPILTLIWLNAAAQKINKADKITLANLQTHIRYLSDDRLEGRRTGTPEEKAASDYIIAEFSKAGAQPKGDNNGWLQTFVIDQGREISSDSYFSVNDHPLLLNKEYFPLSLSPAGQVVGSPAMALQESGVPWFVDLRELLEASAGNAHFDLPGAIRTKAAACAAKGATALLLYNSSSRFTDKLAFDPRDKPEPASIPILFITAAAKKKYLKDESASVDIRLKIGYAEKRRTAHNVVAYLDYGAATTVVIGAHFDHLGHGEDSNTLHYCMSARNFANSVNSANTPVNVGHPIYNGADDNASGVAALIELVRLLAASTLKNNNYLFVAFSAGEMDLAGSDYFVKHPATEFKKLNYMINMDMIGRLNDTTRMFTIGGSGSSPVWSQVINNAREKSAREKKTLSLRDSSGDVESGDHSSFYRAGIPVLFFTTGLHTDYHRPDDKADKINFTGELEVLKFIYSIIESANVKGRLGFAR